MTCTFSLLTESILSTRRLAKKAATDVPESVHIALNDVDKVIMNPHGKTWGTIVNHVGQMKRQSAASNPVLSVLVDELKAWVEDKKGYKSQAKCDEPNEKKTKAAATLGDDQPVKFLKSMGNELAKNSANPMIAFMREMRERDEQLCNELASVKKELRVVNATAEDTSKLAVKAYVDDPDNEEELKAAAVDLYLEKNDVKDAVVERLQVELRQVKEQLQEAKEELEEKKGFENPVDLEEEFENLSTTDSDLQYKYVKKKSLSENIEAYMNNEVKATLKNMTDFHPSFEFKADDDVSNIIERFFVEAMKLAGVDYDESKSLSENIEEHVKKESNEDETGSDEDSSR